MKLSEHVTYKEFIHSFTAKRNGIDNTPNQGQLDNIKLLCERVFEPLRNYYNVPIYISSGFRSIELNKMIGGAKGSQHMATNRAAMDLDADRYGQITNLDIFRYIQKNVAFDQLIWEFGNKDYPDWVHVSFNKDHNRNQILKAVKINGKTKYELWNG